MYLPNDLNITEQKINKKLQQVTGFMDERAVSDLTSEDCFQCHENAAPHN